MPAEHGPRPKTPDADSPGGTATAEARQEVSKPLSSGPGCRDISPRQARLEEWLARWTGEETIPHWLDWIRGELKPDARDRPARDRLGCVGPGPARPDRPVSLARTEHATGPGAGGSPGPCRRRSPARLRPPVRREPAATDARRMGRLDLSGRPVPGGIRTSVPGRPWAWNDHCPGRPR